MNDQDVPSLIRDYARNSPDFAVDGYSSKGGFGHIYFGTRNITGDRVALKFYPLNGDKSDHAEPQALIKIDDNNILKILDARFVNDDFAFHVTPEITGGDLDHYLEGRSIRTHEAIRITTGILQGLTVLHSEPHNWVHMDLKAGNILIDASNNNPYIADFGSVKKIIPGSDFAQNGQCTLYYFPPELIVEGRHYRQSDIYQVGIIFFQLLQGLFPVKLPELWLKTRGRHTLQQLPTLQAKKNYFEQQIKDKIVKGRLLDLNSLPVYVGRPLKTILRKALNLDYQARYPNCPAFQKALYDYQKESKDWWMEGSYYYAYCKSKQRYYKLTFHTNSVLIQFSRDQVRWRKTAEKASIKEAVDYVDNL